jgi:hypothetical protein
MIVPKPGYSYSAESEAEPGWLLTEVYDSGKHKTKTLFAIFDAKHTSDGPIAQASIPRTSLGVSRILTPSGINNKKAIIFVEDGTIWRCKWMYQITNSVMNRLHAFISTETIKMMPDSKSDSLRFYLTIH